MARSNSGPHVALLRGINVGGKNRLAMRELVAIFGEVGATDVRTYIQSGNVVFAATPRVAKGLADAVTACIAERHGLQVPVVVVPAPELALVVAANPYLGRVDEAALHVVFLREQPSRARFAALDPDRSPPDEFTVGERVLYLHCPNGVARSRLTNAWFGTTLGTVSTARNWRTVCRLAEMCGIGR